MSSTRNFTPIFWNTSSINWPSPTERVKAGLSHVNGSQTMMAKRPIYSKLINSVNPMSKIPSSKTPARGFSASGATRKTRRPQPRNSLTSTPYHALRTPNTTTTTSSLGTATWPSTAPPPARTEQPRPSPASISSGPSTPRPPASKPSKRISRRRSSKCAGCRNSRSASLRPARISTTSPRHPPGFPPVSARWRSGFPATQTP